MRAGGYLLDISEEDVDVNVFERLAAEGARLLREGAPGQAAGVLRDALALWRGTPFSGVAAELTHEAALRLDELRLTAVEDRIEAESHSTPPLGSITELRSLCDAYPLRERSHGLLMGVLHREGRESEALTVYENLRSTLATELGADPPAWIRELHTDILRGSATPRSREWHSPFLTRFFGRQEELATIKELMRRARLVTLIGPGGVGKTRIAAEFAQGAGPATQVHFVELAPLREEGNIAEAIAAAVGAGGLPLLSQDLSGHDRFAQLVSALSGSRTLLVLDNCEHLAEGVADIAVRLLAACPELRVLATSREPIAVNGEALVRVGPLKVGGRGDGEDEAVAMFTDLASLARPGLTVDADDAAAIAEICRRLDGLPLAIELAAARTRSMTVQQVARHLDARFRLLSEVRRSVPTRHRTLRAVLDWSWNLLTEHESLLARRLSILPGGATVASAAAVCDGSDVTETDVPYLLSTLADKSLVQAVDSASGEDRYRLMETPRVYLAERLDDAGEEARARAAATRYFVQLAEEAAPLLLGHGQLHALRLLDTEHDNLAETMRHASRHGHSSQAARIALALSWYWVIRGRYAEAEHWFDELTGAAEEIPGTSQGVFAAVRAILPVSAAGMRSAAGPEVSPPDLEDALASFPPLAMIAPKYRLLVGDHASVRADAEIALGHSHPWVRAAGLASLALVAEHTGDVTAAETHTEAATSAFRELGDRWMTAQLVAALAGFQSLRAQTENAVRSLYEAVELERSVGSTENLTSNLIRLGTELVRAERFTEAEEVFSGLLGSAETAAIEHRILCTVAMSDLALARGDITGANRLLSQARELLGDTLVDAGYLRREVLSQAGAIALAQGRVAQARQAAQEAMRAAEHLGNAAVRARAAELFADVLRHEGAPVEAARMLGVAARMGGRYDEGSPRVRALVRALTEELGSAGFDRYYAEGARADAAGPSGITG
ncbi:BTAD domain-containing putative transcriptional regulator [Salinactinospora qingdaonensis]|uniref:BTAD domain-containing putative transcriptional regulator n=2 Tax=Salinactinospora qingdaonensis TaxID=702744 RepID=A0ABP7G3R8_9ACTN